jgi:hypothetical protein
MAYGALKAIGKTPDLVKIIEKYYFEPTITMIRPPVKIDDEVIKDKEE